MEEFFEYMGMLFCLLLALSVVLFMVIGFDKCIEKEITEGVS